MMLKTNQLGFIIVPTFALGEDHKQTLENMGIQCVFLKGSSEKKEYEVILGSKSKEVEPKLQEVDPKPQISPKPAVAIMFPEFLFGNNNHQGIIDRLDGDRVKFISLDEAHLMFEWVTFQTSYGKLQDLHSIFTCPIMALSATMKPKFFSIMRSEVLDNPVVLKGTLERPNVDIHIGP